MAGMAALLIACGGGNGGGSAPSPAPTVPPVETPLVSAWQPPELLEKERGDASNVQVVTDAAGRAIALWSQVTNQFAGAKALYVRHYAPATGWGAAELLSLPLLVSASNARVAMDPASGTAMAVWGQVDPASGMERIWARRYTVDGGWEDVHVVESPTGAGPSLVPDVAINARGNAVVVWLRAESHISIRRDVWANRHVNGDWGALPVQLDASDFQIDSVKVALNDAGLAVAVWTQASAFNTTARTDIHSSQLAADGQWQPPQLAETDDAGRAFEPQVVMDAQGRALAVWRYSDHPAGYDPAEIRSSRASEAGVWGPSEAVSVAPSAAFAPRLAMDAAGHAMAVWSALDGDSLLFDVWANRLEAGATTWSQARRLDTERRGDADRPHIAMNAAGHAVAVWVETDGLVFDPDHALVLFSVATRRYTPGEGWGPRERIQTHAAGEELSGARVALSAAGTAFAVWLEGGLLEQLPVQAKDPWTSVFRPAPAH